MYENYKLCERLKPSEICLVVEQYVEGKHIRKFHEHVPRSRLSRDARINLLRTLFELVLPCVRFILEHAGNLLGHADGLESTPLQSGKVMPLLEEMKLKAWINDYHQQLSELWDRRGLWDSFDEFLGLNRHAERLLWQFGIFPWCTPEGAYRVEIPLASDAAALSRLVQGVDPAT